MGLTGSNSCLFNTPGFIVSLVGKRETGEKKEKGRRQKGNRKGKEGRKKEKRNIGGIGGKIRRNFNKN